MSGRAGQKTTQGHSSLKNLYRVKEEWVYGLCVSPTDAGDDVRRPFQMRLTLCGHLYSCHSESALCRLDWFQLRRIPAPWLWRLWAETVICTVPFQRAPKQLFTCSSNSSNNVCQRNSGGGGREVAGENAINILPRAHKETLGKDSVGSHLLPRLFAFVWMNRPFKTATGKRKRGRKRQAQMAKCNFYHS